MSRLLCMTEIHEWAADGRTVTKVDLCRSEMRLDHRASPWVWVCPNARCGTAYTLTAAEQRALQG